MSTLSVSIVPPDGEKTLDVGDIAAALGELSVALGRHSAQRRPKATTFQLHDKKGRRIGHSHYHPDPKITTRGST